MSVYGCVCNEIDLDIYIYKYIAPFECSDGSHLLAFKDLFDCLSIFCTFITINML